MLFFMYLSTDVVRAYKNLLQEKEALEASVNVLTTNSNQTAKNPKKEAADHDTKDHSETQGDEKTSASKPEDAKSPLHEDSKEKDQIMDHPLAVKDDEVEDANQFQSNKV